MRAKLNKLVKLTKEYRTFAEENWFDRTEYFKDVRIYTNNNYFSYYFSLSTSHKGKAVAVLIFKEFLYDSAENIDVTVNINISDKELEEVCSDARQTLEEWKAELNKENF